MIKLFMSLYKMAGINAREIKTAMNGQSVELVWISRYTKLY